MADGRINKCGLLSTAQLQLGSYRDRGDIAVTKHEGEDLILGMLWLARIDPLILWKKRTLRFVHAGQEHIITEQTHSRKQCAMLSLLCSLYDKSEKPCVDLRYQAIRRRQTHKKDKN